VPNPMNPQFLNRYSCCLNNPLKFVDPSGHEVVISGTNVETFYNWINDPFAMGMGPGQNILNLIADPLFQAYDVFREYSPGNAQSFMIATTMERSDSVISVGFGDMGSNPNNSSVTRNGNSTNMTINQLCKKSDIGWLGKNVIQGAAYDIVDIYPHFINSATIEDVLGMIPLQKVIGRSGTWIGNSKNSTDILDLYFVEFKQGRISAGTTTLRSVLTAGGYGPWQVSIPTGLVLLIWDLKVAQDNFNTEVNAQGGYSLIGR
jgi:hypothetical protein